MNVPEQVLVDHVEKRLQNQPPRLYRHKKAGLVVRVTGYRPAVLAGRFCTVYQVVWPDGRNSRGQFVS